VQLSVTRGFCRLAIADKLKLPVRFVGVGE
jgi:signal recognition particle GTPase